MNDPVKQQFERLFSLIAKPDNFIPSKCKNRMDNWAVDNYGLGNWFANVSDGGWNRWFGVREFWSVVDCGNGKIELNGITKEQFLDIEEIE